MSPIILYLASKRKGVKDFCCCLIDHVLSESSSYDMVSWNFRINFSKANILSQKISDEYWRKLTLRFPGDFFILLEQQLCRTLENSCVREFAIYLFLRQIIVFAEHLVNLVVCWTFRVDLAPPFYFLKRNRYFYF